ncbi:MAG: pentapeptide repeat-containing protein [Drouetiella hepatica Uher 2000/2452]|jgi:uncharacterized protein YjbI with pentapeptide repeats|uniref:Pentapeptide repeat-containing protein n=1 Tax=Drouetiella hepatica Uher 2000/2452 TaxID=904376 RepID=A0A951QFV2_9CYAN|nr:pentapeptide repeat-containing protein [Drouetiella hepatica Uher 2000/2452]
MSDLERYYTVLGLEPGASLEEVNQAYRDLAFIWHPDRMPKDNVRLQEKAQEKLKDLNEAREKLRSHRSTKAAPQSRPAAKPPAAKPPAAKPPAPSSQTHSRSSSQSYNSQSYNSQAHNSQSSQAHNSQSSQAHNSQSSQAHNSQAHGSSHTVPPRYHYYQPSQQSAYTYPSAQSGQPQRPYESQRPPSVKKSPSDLTGANLSGVDLREKDLSGRNLSQANLSGANLSDAFLHRVNLSEANLSNVNLFRANLLQANLTQANLQEANLIGADLSGADLSGANLKGAKIAVGDRLMVKLTGTILAGATMPDGTVHS